MASRLSPILRSRLTAALLRRSTCFALPHACHIYPATTSTSPSSLLLRHLSTASRRVASPRKVDIGARARQIQSRRLWTYAITFSCIAGFIVIVLSNFQDAMVFYITPSEALEKFATNPTRNRFRLGGLVLDGSVVYPGASPEMEFVITDLMTEILVRYQGELPDLFREGHSVVVEGFIKPFEEEEEDRGKGVLAPMVTEKARSGECYFKATEVLAKHDEKYMPKEVGEALERNRKKLAAETSGHPGEENMATMSTTKN